MTKVAELLSEMEMFDEDPAFELEKDAKKKKKKKKKRKKGQKKAKKRLKETTMTR